jgi:hypothetical protein
MEDDKENIKSFLTILQATIITVLLLTAYLLIVTLKNHTINLSSFVAASFILALFYTSVASFIFSAIFYYLYKNASMLLYLVLFFFSFWALIFILQNSGGRKYDNKIPDNMDGVSESITIFLIKIIFVAIISNFLVILKNWYFTKELDSEI